MAEKPLHLQTIDDAGSFDEQIEAHESLDEHKADLRALKTRVAHDLRLSGVRKEQAVKIAAQLGGVDLPEMAYAATKYLLAQILSGEVEIKSRDMAPVIKATVAVARVELGKKDPSHELSRDERLALINGWREDIARNGASGMQVVDGGVAG